MDKNKLSKLYKLAEEYYKLEPWTKITDNMIFGVKHPETGELNFCSVLGNGGEVFSLNVFPGIKGFITLNTIFSPEYQSHEMVYNIRAIMTDFINVNELNDQDIKYLTENNIDYKDMERIPAFRSHKPGMLPWDIDEEEADILLPVLEQTIIAVKDIMNGKEVQNQNQDKFLFRIPDTSGDNTTWKYEFINHNYDFKKYFEDEINNVYYNEVALKKIQKKCMKSSNEFELDYFFYPTPSVSGKNVKNERPHFPLVVLAVDIESKMILSTQMVTLDEINQAIINTFLEAIEKHGYIPSNVDVIRYEIEDLLMPISEKLGFELEVTDELSTIDEIEAHFIQMLNEQGENQ